MSRGQQRRRRRTGGRQRSFLRRRRSRPRQTRHQRELVEDAPWFGLLGIAGIGLGGVVALGGGSTTVAWTIGLCGASGFGLALLLPFVARSSRPSWVLTTAALVPAFLGGLAYFVLSH